MNYLLKQQRFLERNYALFHINVLAWISTKGDSWDRYNTMCVEGQ